MNTILTNIKSRGKALVENALGVHISRALPLPQNQHSDAVLRRLRQWSSEDVVLDVGANDGRTVLRLQDQLNSPQIFAFEPVSATYQTLVRRTGHLNNVRTFQVALGAEPDRRAMYLTEIDAMNSFSREWAPNTGTEMVEVTTVDRFMVEHQIDFVHYLKVDTEGFDFEVIKGARGALADGRIAILQAEVGFGQMEKELATLEQVREYLAPLGYLLFGIYNQCRTKSLPPEGANVAERSEQGPPVLAYCDALFVHVGRSSWEPTTRTRALSHAACG